MRSRSKPATFNPRTAQLLADAIVPERDMRALHRDRAALDVSEAPLVCCPQRPILAGNPFISAIRLALPSSFGIPEHGNDLKSHEAVKETR